MVVMKADMTVALLVERSVLMLAEMLVDMMAALKETKKVGLTVCGMVE